MKVNFFFLCLFIASTAFSQTFVTTIRTELDEVAGKPLEMEDGSFLVPVSRGVYNELDPTGSYYEDYIYRISPLGAVTDSALIETPGDYYSGSLKLLRYDDRVFFWTTIHDTSEALRPGGLRYGFLSEDLFVEQETILFTPDTGRIFHDCLINHDNNLIFAGNEFGWLSQYQASIIWEIHPEQGLIRKSAVENDTLYFYNIVDIPAFQKYHVCGMTRNCQFSYDLDFEGIVFVQPMEDTIFEYVSVKSLTDSTYARCAGIAPEFPPQEGNEFGVGIFNQDGKRMAALTFGIPETDDRAISLDCRHPDSLIVGGNSKQLTSVECKMAVYNITSLGEVNWQFYYGDSEVYRVSAVLATRDGGCLIAGTWWDGLNDPEMERDVILLKVNRQGQLVGIGDDPKPSLTTHLIYPNPGTDVLYLECGQVDGIFKLYDSYGRQVAERDFLSGQLMLDTSGLAKGLYHYLILVDNRGVDSGKWIKISSPVCLPSARKTPVRTCTGSW
jgi:hypothetical protein